jgi:hypothetical protein
MPNPTAELLGIHHVLNHLPFSKIKMLATEGKIPRKMYNIAPPMCSTCAYGKAMCKPRRNKPGNDDVKKTATRVEQYVSVDLLKSPIPELIVQMSGWITEKDTGMW